MESDKSIELFLEISPPILKTLRLSQRHFHLPAQLNQLIRPLMFCKSLREVDNSCGRDSSADRWMKQIRWGHFQHLGDKAR